MPNPYLAELEPAEIQDYRSAQVLTGATIGYPSWNLLYYCLYCSIPIKEYVRTPGMSVLEEDIVVVETGTNRGVSTIVMAQALRDLGLSAKVKTVEYKDYPQSLARANVEAAGLSDQVEFHLGDGVEFLRGLDSAINFLFIDDNHHFNHVMAEVEAAYPKLKPGAMVYFDNTMRGGVAEVLAAIKDRYGANIVEFPNCSMGPPGNALWQL